MTFSTCITQVRSDCFDGELSRMSWKIFFFVVMTTIPGIQAACSTDIQMKWPLIPTTCTEEVILSTDPKSGIPCPLDFVDDYPISVSNPPFSARTSGESPIDIQVPSLSIAGDYGISVYVKPNLLTGCILHYKSDDGLFQIKYHSTPILTNASVVGKAFATHDPLSVGQWHQVGIGIDISQEKVQNFIGLADKNSGLQITGMPSFNSPGKLRIGGSFDGETFNGSFSCVGLINDKNLDCSEDCYDTTTWNSANMAPEKRHYGTFTPAIKGRVPTVAPIINTSTERLNSCAMLCLREYLQCATIAYDEITQQCSLYAGYYFAELQSSSSATTTLYLLQGY